MLFGRLFRGQLRLYPGSGRISDIKPESVKLNMEKHNYAALMQCFLSNLNPDILTQQVNLFLESCFHSLLPFGSSQHYSEPLQGDALFPRASPLQKQSTGLFLNSPLAEGLLLKVFRALRSATRGSAPWTPQPLKRLAKLFDSGLSRIQVIDYCLPLLVSLIPIFENRKLKNKEKRIKNK